MKRNIFSLLCIFFLASFANANEISEIASERIREQVKAMIKSGISNEQALRMTRMMIQNRYRERNILNAQQIIIDSARQGLATEPVVNKAYEGMVKSVPEDNVIKAMENVKKRYSYAYEAANELLPDNGNAKKIGNLIAESLAAGIGESDLQKTISQLKRRSKEKSMSEMEELGEESFLCLRTMARRGVSSSLAAETTGKALKEEYSAGEMKRMRQAFKTHSMKTDPNALARQYMYRIGESASASDLGAYQGNNGNGFGSQRSSSGSGLRRSGNSGSKGGSHSSGRGSRRGR